MKKLLILFLLLIILSIPVTAATTVKQGIYNIKELNLMQNIKYKVRNTTPNSNTIFMVVDANGVTQEFIRLTAEDTDFTLKPFNYGDRIVIIGNGELNLS